MEDGGKFNFSILTVISNVEMAASLFSRQGWHHFKKRKMKILFVCKGNIGRSQIAESLFNKYTKEHKTKSAGTHVGEKEDQTIKQYEKANLLCEVMDEEGINVRNNKRKQLTPKMVKEADKIIVITNKRDWPDYLRSNDEVIYWNLKDPKGTNYNFHVKIKNLVKKNIKKLLDELE